MLNLIPEMSIFMCQSSQNNLSITCFFILLAIAEKGGENGKLNIKQKRENFKKDLQFWRERESVWPKLATKS